MRRLLGFTAAAAFTSVLALQPAWAQRPPPEHPVFGHMLYSGTGAIATPNAFASPSTIFATGSAIVADKAPDDPSTDARGAAGVGLAGWIEVGGTVYATDRYAAFGKLQLTHQRGVFPAIGVGVTNLTTANIGRFGVQDDFYNDVWESSSLYAVFTYVAGPGGGRGFLGTDFISWVVISGGWGSGIYLEDNPQFSGGGSGGVFGSVAFDFKAGDQAFIRLTTEWDGFDLNLAATAWLSGLELTLGVLSVDEGGALEPLQPGEEFDPTRTPAGIIYNQAKPFVSMTLDFRVLGKLPWIWTKEKEE